MPATGQLVLSLDFELLWGVFDVTDFSKKEKYFQNTRKVIPEILNLFKENKIHCTWATVGMLLNENWADWEANKPEKKPDYNNKELSAYEFVEKHKSSISEAMVFALEIVKEINKTPFQEIASHTYSHYFCKEAGQSLEQFEADLIKMKKTCENLNIQIKSLVFPRNQFNEDYLKICWDYGIETVRSNPSEWYWKETSGKSLLSKLFRTADAYAPWAKSKSYPFSDLKKLENIPLSQKASRFLRPVENNSTLRKLKLERIKNEMASAAKRGEIYHLWWHPHNFGENLEESLTDLKTIIGFYQENKLKYGFQSSSMIELKDKI